jgi:hypothetical protein
LKTVKDFSKAATPRQLGLEFGDVLSRAGIPFHVSCGGPPRPSLKYELHCIRISDVKARVWGSARLNMLPEFFQVLLTLSSFSSSLEVNGVVLKLPPQQFFHSSAFEGSLNALGRSLWKEYKPFLMKSWTSVLNNSNAFFGGVFTRNLWNPKEREITTVRPMQIQIVDGCVAALDSSVGGEVSIGASTQLDNKGYQQVAAANSASEMQAFIKRFLNMLGCRVVDPRSLAECASRYVGKLSPHNFEELVFELTTDCNWVRHVDTVTI